MDIERTTLRAAATVACPWCDEPVEFDARAASLRCEACAIVVPLATDTDAADRSSSRTAPEPVAA